jgi:2-dehydropantoate 2-reductase
MRFAIVGSGAIGGFLGARLALAGEDVTVIARDANLEAIGRNGLRLIEEDLTERVAANVNVQAIGEQGAFDVVLLAVKAQQVSGVARDVARLLGPETVLVTLQNGVPWWFFHKLKGPYEDRLVHAADPYGVIAESIDPSYIVGAVVYPAADLVAPGVVKVIEGDRFTHGEPDGSNSDRAGRDPCLCEPARHGVRAVRPPRHPAPQRTPPLGPQGGPLTPTGGASGRRGRVSARR